MGEFMAMKKEKNTLKNKMGTLRMTGLHTLRRQKAAGGSGLLGHSLRSFPRKSPPTFYQP
jgi:hypothetical protein